MAQRTVGEPPAPVFNSFRRRIYRPFFSSREVVAGAVVVGLLIGLALWVAWRGAHPDPGLFRLDDRLLSEKGRGGAVYERPLEPWVEPGSASAVARGPASAGRGPFPDGLDAGGWRIVAPATEFDESTLYEKIDGREAFYKSFGFQRLHFLSLAAPGAEETSIDIELFDLGTTENALGAMIAEISRPDADIAIGEAGVFHATPNGGALARGRYYVRLVGSNDSEAVRSKVVALKEAFGRTLPGDRLPWAYALLAGRLRVPPAAIQYHRGDAFSFGFATQVYSARAGGDMEVFVSRRASVEEATAMAAKFVAAFAEYGAPVNLPAGAPPGLVLVRNEFSDALDGAVAEGPYVVGVRLAPGVAQALDGLGRLRAELRAMNEPPPSSGNP